MERLIAKLSETERVVFDAGKFDSWCVYIVNENRRFAPKDIDYFTELKILAEKYSSEKVYSDFLIVYNHTHSFVDTAIIQLIENIASTYLPDDQYIIKKWLTVIYAGMIAENNKEKTKLGKRIKHLAIHQLLIQDFTPLSAGSFSRGKTWKELEKVMSALGL